MLRIITFVAMLLVATTASAETSAERAMRAIQAFCASGTVDISAIPVRTHVVKRGQALGTIARDHAPNGTSGRCLARLNEQLLASVYTERCAGRTRSPSGGFYCNEAKANKNYPAWANTLKPRDVIYVPDGLSSQNTVLAPIARAVNMATTQLLGKKVVLVVDVSGSMDDDGDRAKVLALYRQLLGNRVVGVVYFSYEAYVVDFKRANTLPKVDHSKIVDAGTERVGNALRVASGVSEAEALVLIGDAADSDKNANYNGLKPVYALCLRDEREEPCGTNFAAIATITGGQIAGTP